MKKTIEGYVRMQTNIEEHLPIIIDEREYRKLLNPGLWDKVKVTIEVIEKEK
jgi:hypothetical protein